MRDTFWNKHYEGFTLHEPSNFAQYCLDKHLRPEDTVIELGCGNGRDGLALSHSVSQYVGLDACPNAVSHFKTNAEELNPEVTSKIDVRQGDFTSQDFNAFTADVERLVLYSRFSFHSINYEDAERLIENISQITDVPWTLMMEVRTVFDTLYGEGTNVGLHEFKIDHYRRFIDPKVFLEDMSKRFDVRYFEVDSGFAPFEEQDPICLRAVINSHQV